MKLWLCVAAVEPCDNYYTGFCVAGTQGLEAGAQHVAECGSQPGSRRADGRVLTHAHAGVQEARVSGSIGHCASNI